LRGDSCLHVIVNNFGDIDLGACVWCKARSVACSTAQRRGRRSKAKAKEEPKQKRKASEMGSEASEGEATLLKKTKSRSVVEDSEEEWEEWDGVQDKGNWPKDSGEEIEAEEVREEIREEVEEVQEVVEKVRKEDKKEAKRARREARRWERKARRWERSERMDELIDVVRELGDKVQRKPGCRTS
jgi:hypothetical protein